LRVPFEGRTYPETDPAEDAVDIRIDLLLLLLFHQVFLIGRDRFSVKIGLYLSIVREKGGHINDEVPKDRKVGQGFDEGGSILKGFHVGSTRQYDFAIDLHGAGAADRPPAGIAKREGPVLFILNAKQRFQQVHPLSGLQGKGVDPLLRFTLFLKSFNS